MEEKLVSVLVVAWNAEKYIEKTLKGVLGQTYQNLEVLLLDNASTDQTLPLAREIEKNDKRLKIYVGEKNIGAYPGLNFLLEKARGEYVAIQDHDDIWLPEKIKKQIEYLEKNPAVVACGTETFYFYEKRGVFILDRRRGWVDFVDHTSLVFRNRGFRYEPKYLLTDEHFEKKILARAGKIFCLGEGLTLHRLRGDGKNYSLRRFSFTPPNLRDFFAINGRGFGAWIYLAKIFAAKYLPAGLVWQLIRIDKANSQILSADEFRKKYPGVEF